MIYTEIANSIYITLKERPSYTLSKNEGNFIDFIEKKKFLFDQEISLRLEHQLKDLEKKEKSKSPSEFKIRVSEALHTDTLAQIRTKIQSFWGTGKRIIVLIDNLDKSWRKSNKIELQSRWILGLIGVTRSIVKEFEKGKIGSNSIKFNLTIFLRSDIFRHIRTFSREPDKVDYTRLYIDDQEFLFRIIEERFVKLSQNVDSPSELWEKYLPVTIGNTPVKKYLYERIIPRPRDLIYFFNQAKEAAIIRGHDSIKQEDIEYGYSQYSSWLFQSLLVENGVTVEQMEMFLYELLGKGAIITEDILIEAIARAGMPISTSKEFKSFIDHLVSLSVLGRETQQNLFEFEYEFEMSYKIRKLAENLGSGRYKIHPTLFPFLDISEFS